MEKTENTALQQDEWSTEITPKAGWFDINLKEVWKYRDLLVMFVKRDFIALYKQTILGPLWHFIQPVFTSFIFMFVFGAIAKIPTDGIRGMVFYMSGITIWNYFAACLNSTSNTFVGNAAIFGKVYFPRLIMPLSVVLSNIVRFGIQMLLLISVIIFFHFYKGDPLYFNFYWLFIPFLLIVMAGIGLGTGIIISSLTTKYRDLTVLIGFGVQLLMYITPVAYPLSYLREKNYGWVVDINPLSPVVEAFRYVIFQKGTFDVYSLGYSLAFMFITLFAGLLIFNRVEKSFMDTV
jgi:lipopolysaccharide transport system permease protein